jgi:hypothetical protein
MGRKEPLQSLKALSSYPDILRIFLLSPLCVSVERANIEKSVLNGDIVKMLWSFYVYLDFTIRSIIGAFKY